MHSDYFAQLERVQAQLWISVLVGEASTWLRTNSGERPVAPFGVLVKFREESVVQQALAVCNAFYRS